MSSPTIARQDVQALSHRFAALGDPTRLRILDAIARGSVDVDQFVRDLALDPAEAARHLEALADVGLIEIEVRGEHRSAGVAKSAYVDLLAAAAILAPREVVRDTLGHLPTDVVVRRMEGRDWDAVRSVYGEGIATGNATFEVSVPAAEQFDAQWLADHRWVAEIDGQVVGWATLSPVSSRTCYRGVAETSIYVGSVARGRGVGTVLLRHQVAAADAGDIWTVQSSIFPENHASIALHRSVGFRIVGTRSRVAQLDGRWRDTVFMERRSTTSLAGQ